MYFVFAICKVFLYSLYHDSLAIKQLKAKKKGKKKWDSMSREKSKLMRIIIFTCGTISIS